MRKIIEQNLAWLSNYLWKQSINKINEIIGENNEIGFTNTDYFNLSTIFCLGEPQFMQIAEALQVSKPAVSLIVKRLMVLDLVERIQSQKDKRVYYVHVTEKGRQIVGEDYKAYKQIGELIKQYTKNEQEYTLIDAVLEQVVNSIKEKERY